MPRILIGTLLLLVAFSIPAHAQSVGLQVFDGADTDKDGKISRAEFSAAREKSFDRLDRNRDGAVSRDDFGFILTFAPSKAERLDRFIAGADSNNDKKMTRDELRSSPMRLFDRADTSKDDVVDQAELAAFKKRVAESGE